MLKRRDKELLNALQEDASRGLNELAELVGMSKTSCWRRLKDFEEKGYIEGRVTLLNPKTLGFNIQVLLSVRLVSHSSENGPEFERHVRELPEVLQCFSVSGDSDYMLLVVARDMDSYSEFLNQKILHHRLVRSAHSSFTLSRIKYSTALPID